MKASEKKYDIILRLLIIAFILFTLSNIGNTQTPSTPTLKCATTDLVGAVTLQWEILDPGSVDHYNIYWSNSASGPFNKISFINDGSSVVKQITTLNGNVAQYFFFMRSYNAAGDSSATSVLVSNILLQMTVIPKGIAILNWNAFDPSMTGFYNVDRTDESGYSETIYSGSGLSYNDTITSPYCSDTSLSYRVQFTGGCVSSSNIKTDEFVDDTKPLDVMMDSISYDPGGHPIISWVHSVSSDVGGYSIQQLSGGIWNEIGLTIGSLVNSFTADTMQPCTGIKTFAIITLDQCQNKSTGADTYQNPLNTILMTTPVVDECKGTAVLAWNAYNNMTPSLGEYQIYRRENVGAFTLIGTTGGTTYTDSDGFIPGSDYLYFVRAVSQDGLKSSSSCPVLYTSLSPPNPDAISLNYVSVINSQYVEMGIHFGPPETVKSIHIYRTDTPGGQPILIDSITPGSLADIVYPDPTSLVNVQSYDYQIVVTNSCRLETLRSEVSRTIYLSYIANTDQTNTLLWNEYSGWVSIDHYEINRLINDVPDPGNPIATIPTGIGTYTDPPIASQQTGDIISYYVTAFEGNVAIPDSSVSNIVRVLRQPVVIMPNAFVPKGLNNIFRPVMDFVDKGNYKLVVFNKWGLQVFVSTNKDIGWDGKFNGEYVPSGIYFYRLQYSSFTGDSFSKTGSLMLVE
jgi:gliding motility-associated-like protein